MDSTGSPRAPIMDRVAALYRDHFHHVLRVLWRAGIPASEIEDLAHNVYLVVLRKLSTSSPERFALRTLDEERAWLYQIAVFEARNYRSRARVRQVKLMDNTNDVPDPRNEAARVADGEQLLVLLDSITGEGRAVFELVELEGFSVALAARTLDLTESTAHKRLGLARRDVAAAVAKLVQRDKAAGKQKASVFLLPFGEGAWLTLRDLQNPPEGTYERGWERLHATMLAMEKENEENENDRPAEPTLRQPPAQARQGRLLWLARSLQSPLGNILSAGIGGAVVALLFLLWPNARIAVLRIPVPVVFVTSSTTPPAPPAPPSAVVDDPQSPSESPSANAPLDEEARLMRQARVAFAMGRFQETRAALDDYEARYPAGRFSTTAHALRANLADADAQ